MFTLHASGLPDSITPGYRQGLGCWEMLVRQSDPRGFFGDTPTNLCQRAQFIDEYRAPINSTHGNKFRILIPDDWKNDPFPVHVAGSHSVTKSVGPWALWVYGDHFVWEAAVPDPANVSNSGNGFRVAIHREIPIIKERWHNFTLIEHISQGTNNGYYDLTVDGTKLCSPKDYYGETLHADDVGPPYTQFGPYVFDHWPVGVTYRRVFMVLG